jgi:hypothetical protein
MKKENKNIERLFQEKFKDFEVSPPDFIWENIQEKLNPKEKKRRVIPFWFKTAGIAASFVAVVSVVFFSTNNGFKNSNTNHNTNAVVTSETEKENNTSNQNAYKNNASEASTNTNKSKSDINNKLESTSKATSLVNTNSTNTVSDVKTDSKFDKGSIQDSKTYKSNNRFVSNNKKQKNTTAFKKNKKQFNTSNSESIANRSDRNKFNNSLKSNSEFKDFNATKNNSSNSAITDLNSIQNTNSNAALTDIKSSNSSSSKSENTNEINAVVIENGLENSNTTSTSIVAVEEIITDTTTLATVIIEENPMEKLLREKETKKVADEKEKWSKWAVNSYVSPVFFNSFSSGSPLSEEFASNEKTFNNSTSYGVGVAYNVNKRLSIKTGISNLNLDFDTENIAFYSSFEDQSKIANTNIERNANGKFLVLKNEKDISNNEAESQFIPSNQNLGNLNQRTQYIEVPVEMSYALLNKKFGISIKGGMSTLFLTENEVSIKAPDGNMQIGKASNLNNVHFSSNIGLGLNYNFMKNFQLNVEPTLKYQMNTFNKNSENFTPYVIGVNTGISYKF